MTSEEREAVALFRYGLISPILNNHCDRKEYLSEISAKQHNVPYYGLKEFSLSTVERWLSDYKRWGFDGLKPKARSDKGHSRALSDDEQREVIEFRTKNMHLSTTSFYELCVKNGLIDPKNASYYLNFRTSQIVSAP
jgi:hypothetical protein